MYSKICYICGERLWAKMKIFKRWSGALVFPEPEDPKLKILIKVLMPSEIQSIVGSDTPAFFPQRSVRIVEPEQQKVYENLVEQEQSSSRTSSSTSASTSNPSETSQGLLHCIYKNGLPYYTFALSESRQALAAKIEKLHNSGREDFDWIYTFQSTEENKKKKHRRRWIPSGKKEKPAPDLVGWMKVSTSLCPKFNELGSLEHTLETEFVLCSATANIEERPGSPPMQPRLTEKCIACPHPLDYISTSPGNSSDFFSTATPNTSIPTNITNQHPIPGYAASPSYNLKKMHERKVGHASRPIFHGSNESSSFRAESEDGNVDMQESRSSLDMFEAFQLSSPHLELAAIVIRTPFSPSLKDRSGQDNISKNSWGGWGLKFLEKIAARSRSLRPQKNVVIQEDYYIAECSSTDVPVMGSASSPGRCSHDGHSLGGGQSSCGEQSDSSVTVIVPAEKHSLPTLKSTRPSSLIERWKLGGKCDCGGWDTGCRFTLFQSQKQNRNDLTDGISESENSNSLFMLFKGGRQDAPALSMSVVHEGLYFLTFQSQLSALQVFSIGVALLHDRNPVMHEKKEGN